MRTMLPHVAGLGLLARRAPGDTRRAALAVMLLACAVLASCRGPRNPSFPLSTTGAESALHSMRGDPAPARRPIVIIGGFADPGLASGSLRRALGSCFVQAEILCIDLATVDSFEAARERVVGQVRARWPGDGGQFSAAVDVVASSMGGLVAFDAACPLDGQQGVRIERLFTIGTPFRGAELAETFPLTDLIRAMQPGSPFLEDLARRRTCAEFILVPYVRSDDTLVGAANAAPPGMTPWWVPAEPFQSGHLSSYDDPRIQADIARRLRGEPPYTLEPPAPLPPEE